MAFDKKRAARRRTRAFEDDFAAFEECFVLGILAGTTVMLAIVSVLD